MDEAEITRLRHERFDLKHQGRFVEAIPLQHQLLEVAERQGRIQEIANAWNFLSHLYQMNRQYTEAEHAARQAVAVYAKEPSPKAETLGTYQMKLSHILACLHKFDEAVSVGKSALIHFSEFHNSPDEFLQSRQREVELMIQYRDKAPEN